MSTYRVSNHAIERYRSRVEDVSEPVARTAIEELLKDARLRPTPRHWMRARTNYGSGVRFGYSPRASHVALVVRDSTVATVLTRSMFRRTTDRPACLAPVSERWRMEREAA
jgi:hypothetical protein